MFFIDFNDFPFQGVSKRRQKCWKTDEKIVSCLGRNNLFACFLILSSWSLLSCVIWDF